MIKCPECGAISQETPEICKCGYNFKEAFKDMSHEEKLSLCVTPIHEEQKQTYEKAKDVIVKDIDMPFGSMVTFMVKWALASIPAIIIVSIIIAVCLSVFTGLLTGIGSR